MLRAARRDSQSIYTGGNRGRLFSSHIAAWTGFGRSDKLRRFWPERQHSLSVKTESDAKVEVCNVDHIRGLLRHDVPAAMQYDIETMIDTSIMGDHVKALRRHLSRKQKVDIQIDEATDPELREVLEELNCLYEEIVHDSECIEQAGS